MNMKKQPMVRIVITLGISGCGTTGFELPPYTPLEYFD